MPGEPVCRRERRAGESVVDSGYMEAGGRGCGQPAGGGVLSPGPQGTVYHQSGPLESRDSTIGSIDGGVFVSVTIQPQCFPTLRLLGSPLNCTWHVHV